MQVFHIAPYGAASGFFSPRLSGVGGFVDASVGSVSGNNSHSTLRMPSFPAFLGVMKTLFVLDLDSGLYVVPKCSFASSMQMNRASIEIRIS